MICVRVMRNVGMLLTRQPQNIACRRNIDIHLYKHHVLYSVHRRDDTLKEPPTSTPLPLSDYDSVSETLGNWEHDMEIELREDLT